MRLIASAITVLLLAVPALAETNVGVTAAVNPSATGSIGGAVRTISLGDNVVYSERIQTGSEGLVQILLADGTTFMVGPNSDLVIDSFVYDPNAGTAAVTATFTKGVLRFIGGQASKNGGNVTLNTPVGTMGIRGAMVDVVLDPPPGTPQHIDMLFGNEVTLQQGQQLLGRLYAAGYSLVLGPNGQFDPMKTPPGWSTQIQQALAGKLGTSGGAPKGPGEKEVEKVGKTQRPSNSGNSGLSRQELNALLDAAALYDQLRNLILPPGSSFVGGVLVGDDRFAPIQNPDGVVLDDNYEDIIAFEPTLAGLTFDEVGNPLSIQAIFQGTLSSECEENCGVSLIYLGDGLDGDILLTIEGEQPQVIKPFDNKLFAHDDPDSENPMNGSANDQYNPNLTLADTLTCQSCEDLIQWGFWGFSVSGVELEDVGGQQVDFLGTYITGDLTTRAQLNTLASQFENTNTIASYYGDAVGVVHNADAATTDYVATGGMQMDWSFGDRDGTVYINNFDPNNANLSAQYEVFSPSGSPGFVGYLDDADSETFGNMQGAFVNDGSSTAAGVLGTWNYFGYDQGSPMYSVNGVFMGVPSN